MTGREYLQLVNRYWRAERAFSYATRRGLIGQEFGHFGKKLGWSLIRRRKFRGISRVLVPVHITRYFEFAFVRAHMPLSARHCLDVSSPDLYSLFAAANYNGVTVRMANPDAGDVEIADESILALNFANCHIDNLALHQLSAPAGGYDCIWSISVVEHIDGSYDDRQSMRMLYDLLGSGGRLIVTVPVDKRFWIEYRDVNHYGTQAKHGKKYFFQRFYNRSAVWERLLKPIGREPSQLAWFGERVNGRFQDYIARWLKEGLDCIVEDPREIVDHYQLFDDWSSMPGIGVCGLVIDKP